MIVIGYDLEIIASGQVNEPLLTTCQCVLHELFDNIFVLSDYRGHFTLKCHILLAKWSVRVGTWFCGIKESFIMELNPSQALDGGFVG